MRQNGVSIPGARECGPSWRTDDTAPPQHATLWRFISRPPIPCGILAERRAPRGAAIATGNGTSRRRTRGLRESFERVGGGVFAVRSAPFWCSRKSATSFPISALCKADGASALLALRNLLSDLSEALTDNRISNRISVNYRTV